MRKGSAARKSDSLPAGRAADEISKSIVDHVKKAIKNLSQTGYQKENVLKKHLGNVITNSHDIAQNLFAKMSLSAASGSSNSVMIAYPNLVVAITTFPTSQDNPRALAKFPPYDSGYLSVYSRLWQKAQAHGGDFCHILYFLGPESAEAKVHISFSSAEKGVIALMAQDLLTDKEKQMIGLV